MCGIMGYLGKKSAYPILLDGLARLEYRGYDSVGVAVFDGNLRAYKAEGRLDTLMNRPVLAGNIGIGHTRWATHGKPSEANAHPHFDCHRKIAVVHNGIIENFQELKDDLKAAGHRFLSDTDTEVIAHLLESLYQGDMATALARLRTKLRGSYALLIFHQDQPETLYALRQDSPLIIGEGLGEQYIASDIPALLPYTRAVHVLEDGQLAIIHKDSLAILDSRQNYLELSPEQITWDIQAAEKNGYDHFMLKEIFEQPQAIRDTLQGRLKGDQVFLELPTNLTKFNKIQIVAMGTARHAGLVGKEFIERLAKVPVDVELGSEFRYKDPLVDKDTLTLIISQSGETADTLAGLREAKKRGSKVLGITNVIGSSVAREADYVLYTHAGPEIAVASTKAYTTQLAVLLMLALYLAKLKNIPLDAKIYQEFVEIPLVMERTLEELTDVIPNLAKRLMNKEHIFFIGRGIDYPIVQEGALKLKEISYIHAQAYAGGELKHGTLALITEGVPVVALCCQRDLLGKMIGNIQEVKARGAELICFAMEEVSELEAMSEMVYIPKVASMVSPLLSVLPLQLLAYYVANARGCDIDKPRNLAKSVTVE